MREKEKNIPYGVPQIDTGAEIDYTNAVANADLEEWCMRYGDPVSESTDQGTTTINYKARPKNIGKAFKFKIRNQFQWKDKDEQADPPRAVEGMYCKARVVHCDSVGKVWWIEPEKEELVFETTLHT